MCVSIKPKYHKDTAHYKITDKPYIRLYHVHSPKFQWISLHAQQFWFVMQFWDKWNKWPQNDPEHSRPVTAY